MYELEQKTDAYDFDNLYVRDQLVCMMMYPMSKEQDISPCKITPNLHSPFPTIKVLGHPTQIRYTSDHATDE